LELSADPRIRVLRQENQGLVASLNRGLAEARHDLIARMDADDLCAPRRLELQVAHLVAHPDVVAVGCCCEVIDENSEPIGHVHAAAAPRYLRRQFYFRNVLGHAGMSFRRDEVVASDGYRDVGPAEDYDLWVRLSTDHNIACLPDVLLRYRRNPAGVSNQSLSRQREAMLRVRDDLHQRRPMPRLTARSVWREGEEHLRRYSGSCPDAARNYAFDHAWLALLCARRGRVFQAARLSGGLARLLARHPSASSGLFDIVKTSALSRR
jgi:glycosyltransferase involved in cell wall biosynthesis